jgi:ubiquinol-cytochrome c reductase cytochrome b subunit
VGLLIGIWRWIDDRAGISKPLGAALTHPVPPETAELKHGWMYLFGVGALTAFILQVVTGVALATLYNPSTASAYDSLQFITDKATLGSVLRGMHYFGASAMVLFVGLHMLRTFLTGSFKFPRELNWLSGVVLLILTLAMAFTGQLLRWDSNGVWSLVIATEQAGRVPVIGEWIGRFLLAGKTVGATTLSRFFAYHVFVIPAMIFGLLGFHLYLILHNGISEPPKSGELVDPKTYRARYHHLVEKHGKPYFPDAAWHEIAFGVLLIIVILLLAVFIGPPKLTGMPNPAEIDVFPKPDWYFLWYFALLALLKPNVETYFIVLGPALVFLLFFAVPFIANKGERSPLRRPWAPAIAVGVVIMIGALWRYGAIAPWTPHFDAQPLNAQQAGATSGPVLEGAQFFYSKGCEYCHTVHGQGGVRGPDLTHVADRLPVTQITAIIASGRGNMPAYVNNLTPDEMQAIVAFLEAQKTPKQ